MNESPQKFDELERIGRERELIYLDLVITGLRQGELQSITIGKTRLSKPQAWLDLSHQDEKSGKGSSIPLREDLANRMREHLTERLNAINNDNPNLSMRWALVQLPLASHFCHDALCVWGDPSGSQGSQEAMRHSTIDLTTKVCTDPKLLDVAGAIASLPSMISRPIRREVAATVLRARTAKNPLH